MRRLRQCVDTLSAQKANADAVAVGVASRRVSYGYADTTNLSAEQIASVRERAKRVRELGEHSNRECYGERGQCDRRYSLFDLFENI